MYVSGLFLRDYNINITVYSLMVFIQGMFLHSSFPFGQIKTKAKALAVFPRRRDDGGLFFPMVFGFGYFVCA